MKKFFVILSVALLLGGCMSSQPEPNERLRATIESVLEDEHVLELDLNEVTEFEWERAYLFHPYTSDDTISETMGIKFREPIGVISGGDCCNLLVFVRDHKVVEYATVTRNDGYLERESKDAITPDHPIIQVIRWESAPKGW